MRGRLSAIASALSLLVCMGMIVLWAGGGDSLACVWDGGGAKGGPHPTHGLSVFAYSMGGQAGIGWSHTDLLFENQVEAPQWLLIVAALLPPLIYLWRWRSRRRGRRKPGRAKRVLRVAGTIALLVSAAGVLILELPWWGDMLAILAAVPVTLCIFQAERQFKRDSLGLCLNCGYDLRGNVSGVCPECGTPIRPDGERSSASSLKPL